MLLRATIDIEVYGAEDGRCKIDSEVNRHLIAENIKAYFEHLEKEPKVTGMDILKDEIGAFDYSVNVKAVK